MIRHSRPVGEINNDVELTDKFKLGEKYTLCALLSAQPGEDPDRLIQACKLDCAL
jgi:hypothetical protein